MTYLSNSGIKKLFLLACICSSIFIAGCGAANSSGQNSSAPEPLSADKSVIVPQPAINLAEPLKLSDKPEDAELAKKIDEIIEKSVFKNARWGVFVMSLKDQRVLVARDARKLFTPASLQKVLTSIVALDKLGADFRWKTLVYASKPINDEGVLDGDLTIYGEGAPDFDENGLERLINQLRAKGLKRITGNITGDDSYFKGETIGDGWSWNDLQWYYGAEASALTFDENEAGIYSRNGKIVATTDFIEVENDLAENRGAPAYGIKRELGENKFYVWGSGGNVAARVAVEDPALWAARSLKLGLERKGIQISGEAKSAGWKSKNKLDSESSVKLAELESQTLAEIVRKMNKHSVNLYAELLLRTLGKKQGDSAPDADVRIQKLRGDDTAGTAVLKQWLLEHNIAAGEVEIHDGSGLSRLNMVTPESIGRAFIYAAQSDFSGVLKDSLPVAGVDGTLGGRLYNVRDKILAKTGSLTYVNSLGGYAQSDDETLVFTILCNNETSKADSSQIIDEIAALLTDKKNALTNSAGSSANK